MLSYQHAYHAGNLADVHKHAALSWVLAYMTQKPKPLTYIETHAGRGLYDLASPEARKTGEAQQGIARAADWFGPDHPYHWAQENVRAENGANAYPGSPLLARTLLRADDRLHLAELHPQENAALKHAVGAKNVAIYQQDGLQLAQSLCPPTPRRGLMLIDPSWEVKGEYATIPKGMISIAKKWNVGVLMLWYPLLSDAPHTQMLATLQRALPSGLRHEVRFPPARKGHRMIGSGLFVVNPPWGLQDALNSLARQFDTLVA